MKTRLTSVIPSLVLGTVLAATVLTLLVLGSPTALAIEPSTGTITGRVQIEMTTTSAIAGVVAHPFDKEAWSEDANTDANGYYTITNLLPGNYTVQAQARGHARQFYNDAVGWDDAMPVNVTAGNATPGIDFYLEAAGLVVGTATDGSNPIPDLQIDARDSVSDQGVDGTRTDDFGVYTLTLPSGEYLIKTCSNCSGLNLIDEYYDDEVDQFLAIPVTVNAPNTTGPIDFVLGQGGTIMGTVVDLATNQPITDAHVNANPSTGEPWGNGTQVDGTGVYTLSGLMPGAYKVEANADGHDQMFYDSETDWMMATDVAVTAGNTVPNINFALTGEYPGAIVGRVLDTANNPVQHAWVNANSMDHMRWKGASTDASGNFELTGITPGMWSLRANPPDGSDLSESQEMMLEIPAGTPVFDAGDIELPGVNLTGRVLMPDGTPAEWAPVNIEKTDWSYWAGTGTDHEGRFRVGGLTAGSYVLRVEVPWGVAGIVAPDPVEFSITDPSALRDLGDIRYQEAVKHIEVHVVREGDSPFSSAQSGSPVTNVEVNAWRRGADGWASTNEAEQPGLYTLDVAPGTWETMIHPEIGATGTAGAVDVDWVYMGHPQVATFADDSTVETEVVNFIVQSATARVTGRVVGPSGETLRPWSTWVDIRDSEGRGNGVPLSADGTFTVSVGAGTYTVWVGVDEMSYPYWSSPNIAPFSIGEDDPPHDLGTIYLIEKNSGITGQVTRDGNVEEGVAGVFVHAWQHECGWASTTTSDDGNYSLAVISGTWEVNVEPPYTSTYITGQPPQRVDLGDDETVPGIDFVLVEAAGVINGTLKARDAEGNLIPVTDINGGWAYARQGNSPEPIAGAPVDNGQFTLNVPTGTYFVGVWLPPNSGYTVPAEAEVGPLSSAGTPSKGQTRAMMAVADMSAGEQRVSVRDESVPVVIELLPNDALIVGGFFTDDEKTVPATDLSGEVFGMQGNGGAWQAVQIDPATGLFELEVAAGTWNLGYWIESDGYVNSPPPDSRVTISSTQVFTFNFTVVAADAIITGEIQDPDGDPLNHAWAWAFRDRSETSAAIGTGGDSQPPNGSFEIAVPSGGQYEVGAHAPEDWGFIQPDMQVVSPTAGSPVNVILRFKESNGSITGKVYYHNEAGHEVYGWAWVWGWSDDGQHTGAGTDANGNYQLNVVTGTTWHIGASYHPEEGSLFYESEVTDIVMSSAHETADLELELADTALPPAVAATFDPSIGWTSTLSDGTRIEIPAGAMPTTDTVRISITPLVEELPNTLTARPFGFGYAIACYEDSTGNQIVENFNTNVLITFYYTEDELAKRGVTEGNLSPAYFSTSTNSWTKVESFTVDEVANKATVQINHFSTWALTSAGASDEGGGSHKVYLPVVLK